MGTAIEIVCGSCSKNGEQNMRGSYFIQESDITAPKSLIDVKVSTSNFIVQSNRNVFDVYEKLNFLGKGAYGSVYKVRRKNTGTREIIRALKEISKEVMNVNEENAEEVKNEVEVLKNIDHPNIMKIFEFFENDQSIFLVNEFCGGGDVAGINDKYGLFPEFFLKYIMYQVFLAISFLHSSKVVHGDIKRENIAFVYNGKYTERNEISSFFNLLFKNKEIQEELANAPGFENVSEKTLGVVNEICNYEVKILDFGSAKMKRKGKQNDKLSGITGTAYYCSPEVIDNNYDYYCDEWACGVMMYILLTGYPPFGGEDEEEIFHNIKNQELNLNVPELKNVSEQCLDLIEKLLDKDADRRIQVQEALKHEFFRKGISVSNLLKGKYKENSDYLKKMFNNQNIKMRNKKSSKFRDVVIAYIALNFCDQIEEKKAKQVFMEMSGGNKHFLITKETFVSRLEKVFRGFTRSDIENLFNSIDENGTGNIEYEELIRALTDKEKLLNDKNLKEAFNFFDKDGSGSITWNEIAQIVYPKGQIPKNTIQEFLKELGENDENMKIDYYHFKKILKQR
jgi:calcium-dependent protein kinase